jgi:hypothetical protein
LALLVLHLGAIAFYRWRQHKDLVRPMWHGNKVLPVGIPPSADSAATRAWGLLLGGLCAAVAIWVGRQGG